MKFGYMGIETERKFLVKKDRWEKIKGQGILYRQGYLLREEDKTIRIRLVEGDQGYLTIKGKTEGFSRPEYEYPVPQRDAEELLQYFCDAIVSKKRYKVQVEDKLWEVDEFLEDNEGLMIAELELKGEHDVFKLPDWIDKEVTDDPRYYNSRLSVNPFKNWKS
jgi:adenylate cyclase